ncbi:LysR family transcriptional regulator [Terasakiispira papahanaumokuakeensis]|uniref:LysR family transcriptional regulator n=1 Tax=Terasakiispira papahanaumokuakeensis TaxID=197479 RepID=A0A1E2V8J9_9GAMM|nr:LysR family transcriptional regulator [Terasakiispira papahanaumokuakeensis]ODC03304.1 LysR family transcriptional regulator [Terasakiispira papahanaumokuakeensis]
MDTQSLNAFIAVAELASFSLAAEQLYITQPAVSKRIANLEQQLNQRLFDRIGRRITLTQAGQALLPRARKILVDLEDTRRLLDNLSGDIQGPLVLATSHHIGLHRLPPLLQRFTQQFPHVKLDMRFLDSEQAYSGVVSGELELAIVTLAPVPDPSLVVVPVWVDELKFVVAHNHPLTRLGQLQMQDLTHHDAVLPGHLTFTRGIVEKAFAEQDLDLNVALSTNYMETLKMMVSIGLGWSLLPESMIDEHLATLNLQHQPITRPLGYLYHRDRTLSNAARQMIQLLDSAREVRR